MSIAIELEKAFFDFHRKIKIEKYLKILDKKKRSLVKEQKVLQVFMVKEFLEVENLQKLERKGIRALFKKFLGTMEDALDKEQQEYLLAVLNLQSKEKEIEAVDFQHKILTKKLIELTHAEKAYKKLKKKYFIQINLSHPGKARRLSGVKTHILKCNSLTKEVREALREAQKAKNLLDKLKLEISKLDPWKIPTLKQELGGKGRLSSSKKKRYIDKTKTLTFKTKNQLDRFELELKDVSTAIKIDFGNEIESLKQFLNTFFDNLITDWIVEEKIEVASMSVVMMYEKLIRTEKTLEFELQNINQEILNLENHATEIMLE